MVARDARGVPAAAALKGKGKAKSGKARPARTATRQQDQSLSR